VDKLGIIRAKKTIESTIPIMKLTTSIIPYQTSPINNPSFHSNPKVYFGRRRYNAIVTKKDKIDNTTTGMVIANKDAADASTLLNKLLEINLVADEKIIPTMAIIVAGNKDFV